MGGGGGGVTTPTNAISGQSQTCSGNLEISPGTFFRKTFLDIAEKDGDIAGNFISRCYFG